MMLLQWKKKIEKMKAHTLFKAAASIAKLSAHFNNTEHADSGGGQQVTADGDAHKEQEL
jgi:hypothetical protein